MTENQTVVTAAELALRSRPITETITILAGESISSALDKSHHNYMAIFLPANWVTSEITFLGSNTFDGTYNQIVFASDASVVTIASVAASKIIIFDTEYLKAMIAVPFIKLVSTQTQITTDKVITIVLKG